MSCRRWIRHAPDFTLPIRTGSRSPSARSGATGGAGVLSGRFSSVCTTELCTFRDRLATLNQANAQVYGISVDTFFTLKAFHDAAGADLSAAERLQQGRSSAIMASSTKT